MPSASKTPIKTIAGKAARPLGLAAVPDQDPRCVRQAFDAGNNYFFFYGPGAGPFIGELAALLRKNRDAIIVATGSGARRPRSLDIARRKIVATLGTELIDVFFAEYVNPEDDPELIFGDSGVLDVLQAWKSRGLIRYVGATAHDRALARRLADDPRVDVLMHRFNMAHRKAASKVFPAAIKARTPVVAFTATRWGTLLEPPADWDDKPPSAADCYRFCLAQKAVQVVLTGPRTLDELESNLTVLEMPPMISRERAKWEHYGDAVYADGASGFETRWP
jgi:aryl-alcohol dehydrogenase-like predicted oxidoreductase